MLGYIKCDKAEMKVKEYEAYKGLYCSLCKALIKHFGFFSSLILSYDIVFLVLTRLSFSCALPSFKKGRCAFNPTKSCHFCTNADGELRYAAAVSVMMFYRKIRDNISDSPFYKRLLMYLILPYAKMKNRKAERMYSEVGRLIADAMQRQAETEKENTDSPDKAAHESADALGRIISYGLDDSEGKIYRFGYGMGKWVYLCDAADDIESDLKSGSYNVFVNMLGLKRGEKLTKADSEIIEGSLNMSCALAAESFEQTESKTLASVVCNIIYSGTQIVTNNILKGNDESERSL